MEQRGLRVIGEFFEAIAQRSTKKVIYRGHGDSDWELVPSVFRPGGMDRGINDADALHEWRRAAARFANPTPRNDVEWLVLAQHFGVRTQLLDWTTSPLVSLFFACIDAPDADGCVWQARTSNFWEPRHLESVDPFRKSRTKPALIYANTMNARSLAQDSAMSLHCRPDDVIPARLIRDLYTVKAKDKQDTLKALGILGLTEERLFYDMNVVVRNFRAGRTDS